MLSSDIMPKRRDERSETIDDDDGGVFV